MGVLLSRYFIFQLVCVLTLAFAALAWLANPWWGAPLVVLVPLLVLGLADQIQPSHAILRNYPVVGHLRFMLESIRPELRQYLIEDEHDPVPFSREQRALVYQRAKSVVDSQPFGTVMDVGAVGYGWMS